MLDGGAHPLVRIGARRQSVQPSHIHGLVLWLRSDLGITLNGSDVSAWADQSEADRDVTQGTTNQQPTYSAADGNWNGKPSLDFDDVDDLLQSDDAASVWTKLHDGTGSTIVAVFRPTAAGSMLSTSSTINPLGVEMDWNHNAADSVYFGVGNGGAGWARYVQSSATITSGTKVMVIARYSVSEAPVLSMRTNRVEGTAGGSGSPSASAPDHTLTIGVWSTGNFVAIGATAVELAAYERYLTLPEVQLLEDYLARRYGI